MMTERAYTVPEIDKMRNAVEYMWLYGKKSSESVGVGGISRTYYEADKAKCVEEMLRTYMLAGIEPEDLE